MQAIHTTMPMTSTLDVNPIEGLSKIQETQGYLTAIRTEAPQHTWSTIECRMWLLMLLRDIMGLEPDVAVRYALQFNGEGSTLLELPAERWMEDFGDSVGGVIYTTLNGYQAH